MQEDFFRDIATSLDKESLSIMADRKGSAEFDTYLDTGCYLLNALMSASIYGGAPGNKIMAIGGEPATGKSFFAQSIAAHFLETNPTGGVVYWDTEAAVTHEMMANRGIDTNRVIRGEPKSIEAWRNGAIKIIQKYQQTKAKDRPPMLMILDSLSNLSSEKEIQDMLGEKDVRDMTKAGLIRGAFRVVTQMLAEAKIPMILTTHVYDVVGAYVPTQKISGGQGLIYNASTILMLSKSKDRDGKEVVGNFIKARQIKGRICKENAMAELKLSYRTGLDKYYGLLELGEKYGVVKKNGNRIELPSGEKVFPSVIYDNPEKYFTKELLDAIDAVAVKEFGYGEAD
jgi:RecA/RadA recombinase